MQHELAQNWGIKYVKQITCTAGLRSSVEEKPMLPYLLQRQCNMNWHKIGAFFRTAYEDFTILLGAVVMYDRHVFAIPDEDDSVPEELLWTDNKNGKQYPYPRLLFIITGKGPEREKYEEKKKNLYLKCVAFHTMWLSAEDYPLLLGSADLGVSLHTSSSGLDLPMKVVGMFGCGLPVCALSFSCIEELVKVEKNGLLFSSSSELADELLMLFKNFPDGCDSLKSLRSCALATARRWATEWEQHALPLIEEVENDSV